MKNILLSALALSLVFGASAASKKEKADTTFRFTDVKVVKTTPVKDQNRSGTCWCFAGTSLLEDEILRKTGKEIDLSEMFTVRHCFEDKADRYIRMNGATNFAAGGSVVDVPYVFVNYGAMPEEAYSGLQYGEKKHDHTELDGVLSSYVKSVNTTRGKKISTAWKKGLSGILDAYFGEIPETFVYEGVTYTPRSFADSLGLSMDDFIAVTSFTHHPFYTPFAVEVADNWLGAKYMNVPMEEMKAIVDNAIENGYTVEWAADVSEKGFRWTDGFAVFPKAKDESDLSGTELARWVKLSDKDREKEMYDFKFPVEEITVTQQMRQDMFDSQETTDDHGMVIVGKAVDQKGNNYYKVKNSWDTNNIYDGFFYVSEPYFLAKTIDIMVNKAAVPEEISKKFK